MKYFVGNVSRQALGALSILMFIPIIQRHLNKEIWIEVGECVISCHIMHNVLEASSKDSVGVGVGGWRLGCSLIWSPPSTLSAETRRRDSHHVRDCSRPLLNAKRTERKQTGAPWSWHLQGNPPAPAIFLILSLSMPLHYLHFDWIVGKIQ